jgi:hypothetical protein
MGAHEGARLAVLTFDAVTTYADKHWESHARRCVETFEQFWRDIPLRTITDAQLDVWSEWLPEFKQRHAHRPTDNYRFDAVRFAHKVAAIEMAFRLGTGDVLIWIDADCVTHAPVDADWLSGLLGNADLGYLRRARKYPECGFVMIRRSEAGAELVKAMVRLYKTDRLFHLPEWHDCMALDHSRIALQTPSVSLSGDAEATGHPLVNGPLGARLDHLKGARKAVGKSLPADLKWERSEAYWNG